MSCTSESICRTAHIHRCSYTCLHVTCKTICKLGEARCTLQVLTFGTAGSIADFEIQLTIMINMIIKSRKSGQGLGVVVFAMIILQQTTTDEVHR